MRGEDLDDGVEADGSAGDAVGEDELEGVEGALHLAGLAEVPERDERGEGRGEREGKGRREVEERARESEREMRDLLDN